MMKKILIMGVLCSLFIGLDAISACPLSNVISGQKSCNITQQQGQTIEDKLVPNKLNQMVSPTQSTSQEFRTLPHTMPETISTDKSENPEAEDGYRVLVDRLWPRGMKKEYLKYDVWEKDITPSPELRKWFHEDTAGHWEAFSDMYRKELETSEATRNFLASIKPYKTVTLLYTSKEPVRNHARILQQFLEASLGQS